MDQNVSKPLNKNANNNDELYLRFLTSTNIHTGDTLIFIYFYVR